MKLLAITLFMLTTFTQAATLDCGNIKKSSKRAYPINKAAIELAATLNLKTCTNSVKFGRAVKKNKHKINWITVTAAQLEKAQLELINKGGLGGPSLKF